MATDVMTNSDPQRGETDEVFNDLVRESLRFLWPATLALAYAWAVGVVIFAEAQSGSVYSVLAVLGLTAWASRVLDERHLHCAIGIYLSGLVVAVTIIAVRFWSAAPLYLYAQVLIIAAMLTNARWTWGIALGITALLLVLGRVRVLSASDLILPVGFVLFTALTSWLGSRRLFTALAWALNMTQQAQKNAEEARQNRAEVQRVLVSLDDAYVRLERANEALIFAREAAEKAYRFKAEFVANVSHELRTPLNMIIGFSDFIAKSPHVYGRGLPPALLADLNVIQRNAQHLADLVDDVLDLSQIEAGRMALSWERTSLPEIVLAATTAVRPLFESKHLYLEVEVAPDLPAVYCDQTRIREVVLNLLSNAGRFTERGGVHLRAWRDAEDVVVSVADTGPGIPDDQRERIFQPFQQLDNSTRRRYSGSGLGLSISKAFVELHGGRMWLETRIGGGTVLYFRLPVAPPALADGRAHRWLDPSCDYRKRPRRWAASTPVVRPRFVVIEKGEVLQRLLGRYLDHVETAAARSLEEAVAELARVPAQALLINAGSVGEGLQRLNESAALPRETPVIVCSLPGPHEGVRALDVTDYLVKPVSRDALLAALDRLPTRPRTVLVVDDEPEALRLFQRMLATSGRGYRVLRAADGQQALAVARIARPDVILLDLVMPGMDGFRLLEARRADPVLRDVPVIITSARDPASQPIVSRALGLTFAGGLSAPQLLACIEAITEILGTAGQAPDPAPPGAPPGSPASG